jgi:vacuolar-type H+-ATPase subunit C/Vma6
MTSSMTRSGNDFSYATGRVGVLQQRLLTTSDVDRLLGAHNDRELQQILGELKFTSVVANDMESLDELVGCMETWLHKELEDMTPDAYKPVLDILWLKEDAPLIASLLKKYFHLTKSDEAAESRSPSSHDPALLRDLILNGKSHHTLPGHLVLFVQRQKAKEHVTPSLIDASVARYVARTQTELAKAAGSTLLQLYVKHQIDLQNIRIARRLQDNDDASKHFLPGGEVDPLLLTGDRRKAAAALQGTSLHFSFTEEFETVEDSSIAVERSLVKALAHDIAQMRANILGLESAFAYAIIALSQLRILRTILIGKRAGLSAAEIREMLPPFLSTSPYEA